MVDDSVVEIPVPRLRCTMTNHPDRNVKEQNRETTPSEHIFWFQPEEGKKSSFVLTTPADSQVTGSSSTGSSPSATLAKPAHVLLECPSFHNSHDDTNINDPSGHETNNLLTFVVGGLELLSNARNIEAYGTGDDGKETYLSTCRGMKDGNGDDWYRCILIVRGGPQPMKRLHIKLLSLRPPMDGQQATLRYIKLKGRLPETKDLEDAASDNSVVGVNGTNQASTTTSRSAAATGTPATTTTTAATTTTTNAMGTNQPLPSPQTRQPPAQPQQPSDAMTKADMGMAMTGVSMLVRSTETRLLETVTSGWEKVETSTKRQMLDLQNAVGKTLASSTEKQVAAFQAMQQQQAELVALVGKLHTTVQEQTTEIQSLRSELQQYREEERKRRVQQQEEEEEETQVQKDNNSNKDAAAAAAAPDDDDATNSDDDGLRSTVTDIHTAVIAIQSDVDVIKQDLSEYREVLTGLQRNGTKGTAIGTGVDDPDAFDLLDVSVNVNGNGRTVVGDGDGGGGAATDVDGENGNANQSTPVPTVEEGVLLPFGE